MQTKYAHVFNNLNYIHIIYLHELILLNDKIIPFLKPCSLMTFFEYSEHDILYLHFKKGILSDK